jgi:uncharacterized protein
LNITLAVYNVDMKKIITAVFSELDNKNIRLELDSSLSPKTFQDILDQNAKDEENAKTEVDRFDVAYWPEGKAMCLFLGPTPLSKDGKILAYSPANVVGKILDPHLKDDWLDKVETNTNVIIE